MIITILGYLAAFLTTVSFVPQVLRIYKTHDTEAISFKMYILLVAGIILWLIYGILSKQPPVIVANLVTAILAGLILAKKTVQMTKDRKSRKKQVNYL